MAFKVKQKPPYPRRLWSLMGFPGDGKSTFATQMLGPTLVIDADHRFDEVMHHAAAEIYQLAEPADNVLVERIAAQLRENMPEEKIGTVVVDSLTAIITPLVQQAVLDNNAGRNTNRAAAFVTKAVAMRLLQDVVTMWGTDVLWIYHLQQGRDNKARETITTSIPATELARLQRSLNARLRVVHNEKQPGQLGIKVEWCRSGRDNFVLWDESGKWAQMPERLEEAMYHDVTMEQKRSRFSGPEEAWQWAVAEGVFPDVETARDVYRQVKKAYMPESAAEMWELWVVEVEARRGVPQPEDGF